MELPSWLGIPPPAFGYFLCFWYRRRSGNVVDPLALGHQTTAYYHGLATTSWISHLKLRYTPAKHISCETLQVRI